MEFRILLLPLILTLTQANILIKIDAHLNREDVKIDIMGEDEIVIPEEDISVFGLRGPDLRKACRQYHGAWPTNAYLHSPTPWGDLYRRYEWPQVHRKLRPIRATVLSVQSMPDVKLGGDTFQNTGSRPVEYKSTFQGLGIMAVADSWPYSVTVKEAITYEVTIPVGKRGGKTLLSYLHKRGKGGGTSKMVIVGGDTTVVSVDPGVKVVASVTATKGILKIEVVYEAWLDGDVTANYKGKHYGHHFWSYDVNALLDTAGIPLTRLLNVVVQVDFYAKPASQINSFKTT